MHIYPLFNLMFQKKGDVGEYGKALYSFVFFLQTPLISKNSTDIHPLGFLI